MLQKRRKPLFLLTAIALLLCIMANGHPGAGQTIIRILDGSAGQLKKDSVILIEDAKFFDPIIRAKLNTPYKVQNIVSFEVNEDVLLMIQSDFKAKVQLQIKKTDVNEQVTTSTLDFELDYKRNGATAQRKTYVFSNAYRVEVKVLSVDKGAATWDVFSILKVVSQMQSFPDFKFHCSDNAVKSIAIKGAIPPANTTLDELPVKWTDIMEADEYDLEWTYIDSSALARGRYNTNGVIDPRLLFANNASSVSVTGTTYNIPLFYNKKGHLFFRVRSVNWSSAPGPDGGRMEADWSSNYAASGGLGRFDFDGHEQKLNWQSTTIFAEEGKRKSVVQYFDGSLRSRQTVTKDNVSNSTIATENLYDYQGRPVIQVMPVPTLKNVIGYTRGLNRAPGNTEYDKSKYDTLPDPNQYCSIQRIPMDTTANGVMSASRYYSPANDSVTIPKRNQRAADPKFALIPDAEQYPFTEVEYEQDNTGRIRRQSGVGKTFRMGGGRETQYAYGTPDQKELDALFGTEAGNASHYQKNIVRDANGQFSISYTDMRGRTVATALAGSVPSDIKQDALPSALLETRVRNLADPSSALLRDLIMESRKSIEVTRDRAIHQFQYSLTPESLLLDGANSSAPFCYDCLYDLQITITSDCNNGKLPNGVAFDTLIRNFSVNNIDTTCTPARPFSVAFSLMLNKGIYEVTKKLTLSRPSLDYYRDSLFMKRNRFRDFQSFVEEARALVNLGTGCKPACAGCLDSLGTWNSFWTKYKADNNVAPADEPVHIDKAKTMYDDLRIACIELCELGTDSLGLREAMKADITPPSGQYADTATASHKYSIYSLDKANYRSITNYKNENGEPASVYWPASGRTVAPQELGDIEFMDNFQASWADALLPLHPEYCKLLKYEMLNQSHQWDRRIEKIDTYAEALKKGYLNPTGSTASPFNAYAGTAPLDSDPLATLLSGYFKSRLETSLNQYGNTSYSLYSIATISVVCSGQANDPCVTTYGNATQLATSSVLCDADRDNIWNAYKVMYLELKRKLILEWLNTQCPTPVDPGDPKYIVHFAPTSKLLENEGIPIPGDSNTANNEKNKAENEIKKYYDTNCKSYVEYWIKTLGASCANYDTADLRRTVIPKLLKICNEGADENHPYGSSSVAPSSTYGYKSFEDVLREYNQQKVIRNNDCNAYSIEAPRPYDQQLPNSRKPIIGKPSDCECELINRYNNEYLSKVRYKSFGEFMRKQYATMIEDSTADYLVSVCNRSDLRCAIRPGVVTLPTAFQCGTGDICIDCDQFARFDAEFKTMYPEVLPSADPYLTDSVQLSWNKLYERFINYRTGYAKTASEYLSFGSRCGVTFGGYNCDSLNRIFTGFTTQRRNSYAVSYFMTTDKGNAEKFTDPYLMVRNGMLVFPDTIQQRSSNPLHHSFIAKPNNEKKFCAGNGFSVELKARFTRSPRWEGEIMSMAIVPATGTGAGFALGRYKAGPLNGLYLERVNGYGENVVYGSGAGGTGQGFTRILITTDTNVIYKLFTLKEKITLDKYEIYFNNALVISLPRNSALPLPDLYQFGWNTFSRHGNVDWFKYYDNNNDPKYFEEFNDLSGFSYPKDGAFCPSATTDCKPAFTAFFNQARGTNLTYDQIEQLYSKTCGKVPNICGVVDSLENLRNRFNYELNPTRTKVKLVSGLSTPPDFQITEPKDMIRDGAWQWPTNIQSPTTINRNFFTLETENGTELCTGQGFSVEARMKFLSNPFGTQVAHLFSFVAPGNFIARIIQGPNTGGGTGIYLSEIWLRNASGILTNQPITPIQLFANHTDFYNNWQNFRFQIDIDSIRGFVNTVKKLAIVNPFHTLVNSSSIGFEVNCYLAVFDRVKVKNSGSIIMLDEEFNDRNGVKDFDARFICATAIPCQTAFVNYFNQQRGTSYNYQQIDALYNSITGRSLDVCGAKDSLVGLLRNFGKDAQPLRVNVIHFMNDASINHLGGTNMEASFEDGIYRWPDHIRDKELYDLWWRYSNLGAPTLFCGSNGFTVEGRIRALKDNVRSNEENFIVSVGGNLSAVFYKRTQPGAPIHGFNLDRININKWADTAYKAYNVLPVKPPGAYNISNDPAFLSQRWHTFKIKVTKTTITAWWNDALAGEGAIPAEGVTMPANFNGVQVGFMGNHGAIDWLKVYNEKGDLMMHENYDDPFERALANPAMLCPPPAQNCQTSFVNYYNLRRGTKLTFAKIDSIYLAMTGIGLNVCDFTQQKEMLCGRSVSAFPIISIDEPTQCSDSAFFIQSKAQVRFANYIDSLRGTFDSLYKAKCLDAYKYETFTVRDTASEYHYTLYYYDQAGNLVKTIPPAGVRPNRDPAWLDAVALARKNRTVKVPAHELPTTYRYNGLNQVIAQNSPDGGTSRFWYDRLGRLAISQNARQKYIAATEENRQYSYTKYDVIGRITEVGQVKNTAANLAMSDTISRKPVQLAAWLNALSQRREQITTTVYDTLYTGFIGVPGNTPPLVQRNLRNRVSYTSLTDGWNTANYNQGTFYTYDIHGNVDTLLQDYGCGTCGVPSIHNLMNQNGNRFKKIAYNFDLISGKVNTVAYQPGLSDQFLHRYSYDGENRLTLVETSQDGFNWEKDARYEYYLHGPLARTILGTNQVQGIDYAYTLQGWLKGINSAGATAGFDIGGDGNATSNNRNVARDAYGFALNYFAEDFKPVDNRVNPFPNYSARLNTEYRPLYNGNIGSMVSTNRMFENPTLYPDSATLFFNFSYDQLNRLTGMDLFNKFSRQANNFDNLTKLSQEQFKERVSYDPNGNILKYLRHGNNTSNVVMDSLSYAYYPGTNRLRRVRDNVPDNHYGSSRIIDIDNQTDVNNYVYDSIGNLIQDKAEKINNINWNVYGKITGISRGEGPRVKASEIYYTYDASGNRISKVIERDGKRTITWYVRDAQGNVMAAYSGDSTIATALKDHRIISKERYIYGTDRVGVDTTIVPVDFGNAGPEIRRPESETLFFSGARAYELSNHLGNVLVTISDRKKGIADPLNAALIKFFEPMLLSGTDYYPFGMPMRIGADSSYRYGFNGQEKSNEIKGEGNSYNAEYWEYDPRIGRRWNIDPVFKESESPYLAFAGNPIWLIDQKGADTSLPAPAGGSIKLPDGAGNIKTFDSKTNYTVAGKKIQPVARSVQSFSYNGVDFSAQYYSSNQEFAYYLGSDGSKLGYEINTVSPTWKFVGQERLATAGLILSFPIRTPSINKIPPAYVLAGAVALGAAISSLYKWDRVAPDIYLTTPFASPFPTPALPIVTPFIGHGNKLNNWNPHLVYVFSFVPTDNRTPILKYGIADMYTTGFSRPESQKPYLMAMYGASVNWKPFLYTPDRASALAAEKAAVYNHISIYGEKPRVQFRP